MKLPKWLRTAAKKRLGISDWRPMEATAEEWALIKRFKPYTMTSELRMWMLLKAAQYVARRNIPGDIVESGVWRGGNVMFLRHILGPDRTYWLFDTFAGMSEPNEHDATPGGRDVAGWYRDRQKDGYTDWCYASFDDVQANFRKEGLLGPNLRFVKGKVQDTLKDPANHPERIALLRLDTDFHESTEAEMANLYPRLATGGVFIADDYGAWLGHRKAIDDYFGDDGPLLISVDRACRFAIKV